MEDQLKEELANLLKDTMEESGKALAKSSKELANLAIEKAKFLASIRGMDEFDFMLKATKNNLALQAGIAAVEEADAIDARIHGIFETALTLASKALLV